MANSMRGHAHGYSRNMSVPATAWRENAQTCDFFDLFNKH